MKHLWPVIFYFIASYGLIFIFGYIWRGEREKKKQKKPLEDSQEWSAYNDEGRIDVYG